MRTPAHALAPSAGERAGYWVEVRDATGELIYYCPLHDPIRADVEVFGDEPGAPIYRVPNDTREGEFDVLVPDLPHASHLALNGPPSAAEAGYVAARELVRHDFSQLRRLDVNPAPEEGRP